MKLLGRSKLLNLRGTAAKRAALWAFEVSGAKWTNFEDLAAQFPGAKSLPSGDVEIPLLGASVSVSATVAYKSAVVFIKGCSEMKS